MKIIKRDIIFFFEVEKRLSSNQSLLFFLEHFNANCTKHSNRKLICIFARIFTKSILQNYLLFKNPSDKTNCFFNTFVRTPLNFKTFNLTNLQIVL